MSDNRPGQGKPQPPKQKKVDESQIIDPPSISASQIQRASAGPQVQHPAQPGPAQTTTRVAGPGSPAQPVNASAAPTRIHQGGPAEGEIQSSQSFSATPQSQPGAAHQQPHPQTAGQTHPSLTSQTASQIHLMASQIQQASNQPQMASQTSQAATQIHLMASQIQQAAAAESQTGGENAQAASQIHHSASQLQLAASRLQTAEHQAQSPDQMSQTAAQLQQAAMQLQQAAMQLQQAMTQLQPGQQQPVQPGQTNIIYRTGEERNKPGQAKRAYYVFLLQRLMVVFVIGVVCYGIYFQFFRKMSHESMNSLFAIHAQGEFHDAESAKHEILRRASSIPAGSLREFAESYNPKTRSMAAIALGQTKSLDAIDILMELLEDESIDVRIDAIEGIKMHGSMRLVMPLIERLKYEEDDRMLGQLGAALGEMTGEKFAHNYDKWHTWAQLNEEKLGQERGGEH
ncbi:MAG: HEAT repeat domain-containing protein [Planctomycetota bacterium]|jgi:hypothetical protein|nr:HEAT repeat domain-containing protein [Planctomycetota bacterium]MDP7249560.1 HEAT repeat domain-containing protein [Planctomycetota bacterium]